MMYECFLDDDDDFDLIYFLLLQVYLLSIYIYKISNMNASKQ